MDERSRVLHALQPMRGGLDVDDTLAGYVAGMLTGAPDGWDKVSFNKDAKTLLLRAIKGNVHLQLCRKVVRLLDGFELLSRLWKCFDETRGLPEMMAAFASSELGARALGSFLTNGFDSCLTRVYDVSAVVDAVTPAAVEHGGDLLEWLLMVLMKMWLDGENVVGAVSCLVASGVWPSPVWVPRKDYRLKSFVKTDLQLKDLRLGNGSRVRTHDGFDVEKIRWLGHSLASFTEYAFCAHLFVFLSIKGEPVLFPVSE